MILYMTALLLVHPMKLRLMNEYHKLFWIWMTPTLFLICVSSIATQTQFILGGIRHLSRRHHSSCWWAMSWRSVPNAHCNLSPASRRSDLTETSAEISRWYCSDSIWPRNLFSTSTLHHTGRFNVKYCDQLRKHHPDSRYVSVILQYVKPLALHYREHAQTLTINALFHWESLALQSQPLSTIIADHYPWLSQGWPQ